MLIFHQMRETMKALRAPQAPLKILSLCHHQLIYHKIFSYQLEWEVFNCHPSLMVFQIYSRCQPHLSLYSQDKEAFQWTFRKDSHQCPLAWPPETSKFINICKTCIRWLSPKIKKLSWANKESVNLSLNFSTRSGGLKNLRQIILSEVTPVQLVIRILLTNSTKLMINYWKRDSSTKSWM